MSAYINSVLKRGKACRKSQKDLELFSANRTIDKKIKFDCLPGKSKQERARKGSDFGMQLSAKQSVKNFYGLREKQFKSYVVNKSKKFHRDIVNKADVLLVLLESRLDNLVYRMGFAVTRRQARQMVSHYHILVNGHPVNIPSYQVKAGDVISVSERAKGHDRISSSLEINDQADRFDWLKVDSEGLKGTLVSRPDIEFLHQMFDVNLIIEFYSK